MRFVEDDQIPVRLGEVISLHGSELIRRDDNLSRDLDGRRRLLFDRLLVALASRMTL